MGFEWLVGGEGRVVQEVVVLLTQKDGMGRVLAQGL